MDTGDSAKTRQQRPRVPAATVQEGREGIGCGTSGASGGTVVNGITLDALEITAYQTNGWEKGTLHGTSVGATVVTLRMKVR